MPLLRKMQSNGRGPRVEVFKIDRKNSNDTPIDSPWKTKQLLWRHLMVIYYGMGVVPQKPKFNVNFQKKWYENIFIGSLPKFGLKLKLETSIIYSHSIWSRTIPNMVLYQMVATHMVKLPFGNQYPSCYIPNESPYRAE